MIGRTVSHYKIIEEIGRGGMGVVYKAHDVQLDRDAALKFLPRVVTTDPSEKERFYHEARAASALNHPHVTTIYEIGEYEGQPFLAMELVEGKTLKQIVESESPSVGRILDIATQVGQGLAAAHEKDIVHRDIKSENIMLTAKGQAKIMDFGLAKVKGATRLTKTGSTLGTAAYMSPEQARGEDVDRRSDIFSLGVVLYELITGRLPFKGEHHAALLYSIVNEEPPSILRFNENAGDGLQRIVFKALEKNREERYQHVDDMLADIRKERKTLEQAEKTLNRSRPGQPRTVARTSSRHASDAKPAGIRRVYWIPAAIAVAAVVCVVLIHRFRSPIGFGKEGDAGRKSIAVLPFTNMSDDKEDEFFSDGITEDIIAQLSNIADLSVISRTSVMPYKRTNKRLQTIAGELHVATVLEGSVRRSDNQVRIVAQMIDATSDKHLWAQTYDKELTSIFAIQSDVARQIASALEAKLSPREKGLIDRKPTNNIDAYTHYLRGRDYYYRYTERDNGNAIVLFKKALALDRNYALAYAGLSDAYAQGVEKWGFPRVWVDSSIAMGQQAVGIDPNLAEGYKALGLAYSGKGWLRKSLAMYRKAVEINPKYHPAFSNIGYMYMNLGKLDEALVWQKKALALNPMVPYSNVGVGVVYLFLADYGKSEAWLNKALALQPDLLFAQVCLGWVSLARGENRRCLEQAQKILSVEADNLDGLGLAGIAELFMHQYTEAESHLRKIIAIDSTYGYYGSITTNLGYIYWKTGRKDEARRMFARSLSNDETQMAQGNESLYLLYDLACIHAIQGHTAQAYQWLQKAIEAGWTNHAYIEHEPLFESIRNDERYKRIVADLKASVAKMRERAEEIETD